MILISTLPVKGEESLDLQSPLTTSPNLDNCISTPLPEQPVDSDDRHGFLTGRCGRHAKSGEPQPLYKYAHGTGQYASVYCRVRVPAWSLLLHKDAAHCSLTLSQMFITVSPRTSDAIAQLQVNLISGVVLVEFENLYSYEYTNVSRRAIANLLLNPNMSLGFWVNKNCVNAKRTSCLNLA